MVVKDIDHYTLYEDSPTIKSRLNSIKLNIINMFSSNFRLKTILFTSPGFAPPPPSYLVEKLFGRILTNDSGQRSLDNPTPIA